MIRTEAGTTSSDVTVASSTISTGTSVPNVKIAGASRDSSTSSRGRKYNQGRLATPRRQDR
jgi:hypothetical protein